MLRRWRSILFTLNPMLYTSDNHPCANCLVGTFIDENQASRIAVSAIAIEE